MSRSTQRALQVASDTIVKQEDQIKRALHVLQHSPPHDLCPHPAGVTMRAATLGDWISVNDVITAIGILQEGQQ